MRNNLSAYDIGRQLALEKSAAGGLQHVLRRLGRQFAVGMGRKAQEIAHRGRSFESLVGQARSRLGGRKFTTPTEKLYRPGGAHGRLSEAAMRDLGATAQEHPFASAVGGGLTVAEITRLLNSLGRSIGGGDQQQTA